MLERREVPQDDLEVVGGLVLSRLCTGGFEGNRGAVFPKSSFLSQRHEGLVAEQGLKITLRAA